MFILSKTPKMSRPTAPHPSQGRGWGRGWLEPDKPLVIKSLTPHPYPLPASGGGESLLTAIHIHQQEKEDVPILTHLLSFSCLSENVLSAYSFPHNDNSFPIYFRLI